MLQGRHFDDVYLLRRGDGLVDGGDALAVLLLAGGGVLLGADDLSFNLFGHDAIFVSLRIGDAVLLWWLLLVGAALGPAQLAEDRRVLPGEDLPLHRSLCHLFIQLVADEEDGSFRLILELFEDRLHGGNFLWRHNHLFNLNLNLLDRPFLMSLLLLLPFRGLACRFDLLSHDPEALGVRF